MVSGVLNANRSLAYELWEVLELLPFHDRAEVICYFLVTFCYVMLCLESVSFFKTKCMVSGGFQGQQEPCLRAVGGAGAAALPRPRRGDMLLSCYIMLRHVMP
jgi:hypothetical protein